MEPLNCVYLDGVKINKTHKDKFEIDCSARTYFFRTDTEEVKTLKTLKLKLYKIIKNIINIKNKIKGLHRMGKKSFRINFIKS